MMVPGGYFSATSSHGLTSVWLHAERDLELLLVDVEHHDLGVVSHLNTFARMVDAAGPGHLGDVDEPFDALFDSNEGSVGHQIDHGSLHAATDRVLLLDLLPGGGFKLLESEGDLLLLAIDVEDLDFHLLSDADDLGRMIDPAPAHVGDVKKTVDSTEVDEGAEFRDVGDGAADHVVLVDGSEQVALGVLPLLFDQLPTADDDVPAFLVDLEDDGTDIAADEFTDVARTSDVHLAGGQEHRHADVDQQAALDLPHALAFDDVAFGSGSQDLFPSTDAIGLSLREHDRAAFVFGVLEQDLDFVSGLEIDGAVVEFGLGDEAFALEADVDHDEVAGEVDDLATENGAGGETVHVLAEQRVHVAIRDVIAEGGAEKRFGLEIFDPEVFNKVVVDHGWGGVASISRRRKPTGESGRGTGASAVSTLVDSIRSLPRVPTERTNRRV